MQSYFFSRPLPPGLEGIEELALDLRWTWSHFSDRLWDSLDPDAWERTGNPYYILQSVPESRLEEVARDPVFLDELRQWIDQRRRYVADPGWFGRSPERAEIQGIAYFSMEFGLSEALPIYSGGLGILAGDVLKTASDLGVPMTGVGLLYQQGYFRQVLSKEGWQHEAFPYNDPISLPVMPVRTRGGGWMRIRLELPGRTLLLRVWEARVGKITLYLLDSNDQLNNPADRSITAHLYPAGQRDRFLQEIVLGIGGWQALEALGIDVDICHLNEGHAALAILARTLSFMRRARQPFRTALTATRTGNVFTTHTPVEAAFDRFDPDLVRPYAEILAARLAVPVEELLALGRRNPQDRQEPFHMAYLAVRGSGVINGVSRLHGAVSQRIFQVLFPDWPEREVPIEVVTNGVHVSSWDSADADALWTRTCGKGRWGGEPETLCPLIQQIPDKDLWSFRAAQRQTLVRFVRRQLVRQLQEHAAPEDAIQRARHVLDPNLLTVGFARRFTEYKRPTLLLQDAERLARLLCHPERPIQLIVAGKAHPNDEVGKRLVQQWTRFARRADLCHRVVFLEDYDMGVAGHVLAGIDVWLNTPRRTREASGTSGMKVLVNGGLNLSELDGWWDEAFTAQVGWALGDGRAHDEPEWDTIEAGQLLDLLEHRVIPTFYERNHAGMPRPWLEMVRASMATLTPRFSSNRMMRDYLERIYLPAARAYRRRSLDQAKLAAELVEAQARLAEAWRGLRFGEVHSTAAGESWRVEVQVYCDDLSPEDLRVELYAEPLNGQGAVRETMRQDQPIPGAFNAYLYVAEVPAERPASHYTPRIVPRHPEMRTPLEDCHILWKH